ncbi:hypothetical protein BaRGS_00027776 [Batillaria attramentaria]|uniref:Uncharacterized protein n=1 Tax=Batillaria attramentaria TaxID=370345 RepID=A0ABD0K257_9CAEN
MTYANVTPNTGCLRDYHSEAPVSSLQHELNTRHAAVAMAMTQGKVKVTPNTVGIRDTGALLALRAACGRNEAWPALGFHREIPSVPLSRTRRRRPADTGGRRSGSAERDTPGGTSQTYHSWCKGRSGTVCCRGGTCY